MSMVKCPECGKDISSKALICPHCGFPIMEENTLVQDKKQTSRPTSRIVIAIIVACICFLVIWTGVHIANACKATGCNNTCVSGGSYCSRHTCLESDCYSYRSSDGLYCFFHELDYASKSSNGNGYSSNDSAALKQAHSYLNSSAFSYTGLIEQLEYHGYSNAEAVSAADACGANWKEQALKKAKSYLQSSAFSYSGLIDQLEYSGFTNEEAQYGADNCGANWKEQAVKKAASYIITFPSWTRSELIEQLEYSGFTYDQASYGASQNGY